MPPIPPSSDRPVGERPVGERIAKLLARAGVASRREIERMIAEERIALNGTPVATPATVLTTLDGVTVDGHPVAAAEPTRLFVYHKPPGLLVTERDPAGRLTIYDRLPRGLPRLLPVGRLDLATEGLLLLTTDGELKRQLELPATGVERAYRARAYGTVTQAQLEELIDGVEVEGVRYGRIDANLERRTGANVWIELTLTEGKNREVRRVLEHLGLRVSRLIRTRYGPFVLGDLPVGEVGEVPSRELDAFRRNPRALPPARAVASREEGASQVAPRPVAVPGRAETTRPPRASANGSRATGAPARPPRGERDDARPSRAQASRSGNAGAPARPASPSKPGRESRHGAAATTPGENGRPQRGRPAAPSARAGPARGGADRPVGNRPSRPPRGPGKPGRPR